MLCRCWPAYSACICVVPDRGYSSHALRDHIWSLGARSAIPPKRNEATVAYPEPIYDNRNSVERFWTRLKEWRAVATRYEKTKASFLGVLCLAATDASSGANGL